MGTLEQIKQRLEAVYSKNDADVIFAGIQELCRKYGPLIPPQPRGWSEKDTLLITYADSIRGPIPPLQTLHHFLRKHIGDLLSFVHLLPFYPFTSDDGFSVVDFRALREDLGTWNDIKAFAQDYRLVFDAVINHVSASSAYVKKYCDGDPAFADFVIALNPSTDTSSVLRTRNLPLLHDFHTRNGIRWLWTTFSRDQVDLNYANPRVLLEILDILLFYAQQGCAMLRLDAIPYLWKELGTSCAHLPQTHELIKLIRDMLDLIAPHVLLLTETNVPHQENVLSFGDHGDEAQMIYNFPLAPLIVWSLFKGDASVLSMWAKGLGAISSNATYLNITATHDGIGMRPTEGILSEGQRAELVQLSRDRGGDVTGKRNADGSISPYELNLSYFDAINDPRSCEPQETQVARFVLSQAITMALMGIPGFYIHSLVGSRNDSEGVKRTGRARSINRNQMELAALETELAKPGSLRSQVFTKIAQLLRLRGTQSVFHPDAGQEILDLGSAVFAVRRCNGQTGAAILALHDVSGCSQRLLIPANGAVFRDLISGEQFLSGLVNLAPYQVCWLVEEAP
ncbi:MAG: sugar phosphorylase [Chthoniobacteraceae bacterium]